MEIGKRIESIRKRKGISAEDLAEIIGVSPSTIYRYAKKELTTRKNASIFKLNSRKRKRRCIDE